MNSQLKTVNEIAKMAGITVRTLHYYDEINLLKPSDNSQAVNLNLIMKGINLWMLY